MPTKGNSGLKNTVHCDWELTADPSRVVLRPFSISPEPRSTAQGTLSRAERVIRAVVALSDEDCARQLEEVDSDFHGRHWQTHALFLARFRQVEEMLGSRQDVPEDRATLIGAYFSHEYSYAAAAIMNPSIVPHPDQTGLDGGWVRFVMSLRTVGEGHISTISFVEGVAGPDGEMKLWPKPPFAIAASADGHEGEGGPITLRRSNTAALSATVLFPATPAQRNGLEDLRLTHFTDDDGRKTYLGTYTAYSGREVGCELLETDAFQSFRLTPFRGAAAQHKGLAIFPRRINGEYAAIGRLDHESLYFMRTTDRFTWNNGQRIIRPTYPWELIQTGNCGSPIETEAGWLLLTHGVGAMRQYALGAALLDLNDPTKVLARTPKPILKPSDETREGYVPNVVYTCGAMLVGKRLFIPYGVADSAVRCLSVAVDDLLAEMEWS